MRFRSIALGLIPALAVLYLPSGAAGAPHPRLAGSWAINLEKSESQHQQIDRGFGRGRGGGGGRPGGRDPGGRGNPGGSPEDGADGFPPATLGGGDRGLGELLRPKQKLVIVETDSLITVRDDAGWSRELIPTGQPMREDLGQGGPAEVTARWKGDKLITERKLDRGGDFKETYSLDKKTGQLLVGVQYKTDRMPRPIEGHRVYDPMPAGS